MTEILFPNFLNDPAEYERASSHWLRLWNDIAPTMRSSRGWRDSWVSTGAPDIRDGNPIFSAVSDTMKRGIRIIQTAQRSGKPIDFAYWLDTFGGSINDPDTIIELVIACVLSRETASIAQSLMADWVAGPIQRSWRELSASAQPSVMHQLVA